MIEEACALTVKPASAIRYPSERLAISAMATEKSGIQRKIGLR